MAPLWPLTFSPGERPRALWALLFNNLWLQISDEMGIFFVWLFVSQYLAYSLCCFFEHELVFTCRIWAVLFVMYSYSSTASGDMSLYISLSFLFHFLTSFEVQVVVCMPLQHHNLHVFIKLMKGKAPRNHSLHEKTAASVWLTLFISSNEWCHTTDAP